MKSLEEQISDLVAVPGVRMSWTRGVRRSVYQANNTDIFDGNVCKELPGHDGQPFFLPDQKEVENGELRVGVSLGVDWYVVIFSLCFDVSIYFCRFSYLRSQISASHTSGPMSFQCRKFTSTFKV